MISFRIYYSNDTVYEGEPEEAPGTGVIAIVQKDEDVGRVVLHGDHVYCWHEDGWCGHNILGWHLCAAQSGWKKVVFGVTIPKTKYLFILHKATKDEGFPVKSARLPIERHLK